MRWGADVSPRGHAFISYVREDGRRVDRLQKLLEANGVPVWRDTGHLWPGEDWRAKIREAIAADSLAFVACFSKHSEDRQKSYQRDELLLAIEQLRQRSPDRPYLLPVRFDDCPIPDWEIGGGRTLSSLQWVDLFGRQWQSNAERLVEGVQHILHPVPADGRSRRRSSKKQPVIASPVAGESRQDRGGFIRRLSRRQLLVAALACLVVVVVATVVGIRLSGSGSTPGPSTSPPGVPIMDVTGTISVVVPRSWDNRLYWWQPKQYIPGITYGTRLGPGINAAPNVAKWFNDWTTPGIFVGSSKLLVAHHYNPATALSTFLPGCNFSSRRPAESHDLTGYKDTWVCPNSTTRWETVALWPKNHSFIVFIQLKIVTPADETSGKRALSSLSVRY
jgi:TIR domain